MTAVGQEDFRDEILGLLNSDEVLSSKFLEADSPHFHAYVSQHLRVNIRFGKVY